LSDFRRHLIPFSRQISRNMLVADERSAATRSYEQGGDEEEFESNAK